MEIGKKKWVVLDIDGTLISSRSKLSSSANSFDYRQITFTSFEDHTEEESLWVLKRPNLDKFLSYCCENFNVGVWSCGQPDYVNAVVRTIFPQPPSFVYNWTHCSRNGPHIYKSLIECPFSNEEIILIDDTSTIVMGEVDEERLLLVPSFKGRGTERNDDVLLKVIEYLSIYRTIKGYPIPEF